MAGLWTAVSVAGCNAATDNIPAPRAMGTPESIPNTDRIRSNKDFRAALQGPSQSTPPRLDIDLEEHGSPSDFSDKTRILHAHFVSADVQTLIHEHPKQTAPGHFVLDLPEMAEDDYSLWLEVTASGEHHAAAFLDRFPVGRLGAGSPTADPDAARISARIEALNIGPPGELSHLHFAVQRDGQPVEQWGTFIGVAVHTWAVSRDGTFLVHGHADTLAQGLIDVHVAFPKRGEYTIFIQPAVRNEAGLTTTPVLRYSVVVP